MQVGLFAPDADKIEFCLFSKAGDAWVQNRIEFLTKTDYGNWFGEFDNVFEGQHYGFRVHGKWDPNSGFFFNPAKLMLDPYAKGLQNRYFYQETVYPFQTIIDQNGRIAPKYVNDELQLDKIDNAPHIFHGVVIADGNKAKHNHLNTPWNKTIIYECHVVGLTKNAPWLQDDLKGTYAGIAHPKTIEYLKNLGVTAIELLPIYAKISESHLYEKGLENYWGYSTLSYFAPEQSYATKKSINEGCVAVINEIKNMIKSLHDANIEVILDVVYNHTCEESNIGPCLCFRGIANNHYYLQNPQKRGELDDTTGCGNSLNFKNEKVIKLTIDSLKYWVEEFGVDGFRFDLMVTCARDENGFTSTHPLLMQIKTDPILSNRKIIAEPWDLGIDGWKTGHFKAPISEWNDSFRNCVRTFWVSDKERMSMNYSVSTSQEIATKLAGSSDVFNNPSNIQIYDITRKPFASINYITAHDGFTMFDLLSFNEKNNKKNGESNRDGSNDNNSFNHGYEGLTQDNLILNSRIQTLNNLFATLLLSNGVPMIVAGDEFGRTQYGNNNAYCQNNSISWLDWNLSDWQKDLTKTVKELIKIRLKYPALQSDTFFEGLKHNLKYSELKLFQEMSLSQKTQVALDYYDLCWFTNDGELFTESQWNNTNFRTFQAIFTATYSGEPDSDKDVLVVVNGNQLDEYIILPKSRDWDFLWSSAVDDSIDSQSNIQNFISPSFSMQIFIGKKSN